MCVIYYAPDEDKRPPLDELEDGAACNRDGGGIAYFTLEKLTEHQIEKKVKPRRIPTWKKGYQSAKLLAADLDKIEGPVLIHFRWASIGAPIPELTHPFPITPKAEVWMEGTSLGGLLMQNGTWSAWKHTALDAVEKSAGTIQIPDRGPWSDTRALAFLAGHYGVTWLDFKDHGSKLAVMLPNKIYALGDGWITRDGWKQSSSTFRSKGTSYPMGGGYSESEKERRKEEKEAALAKAITNNVKDLKSQVTRANIVVADPKKHYSDEQLSLILARLEEAEVPVAGLPPVVES